MAPQDPHSHALPLFLKPESAQVLILSEQLDSWDEVAFIELLRVSKISLISEQYPEGNPGFLKHLNFVNIAKKTIEAQDFIGFNIIYCLHYNSENIGLYQSWAKAQNAFILFERHPKQSDYQLGELIDKKRLKVAFLADSNYPEVTHKVGNALGKLIPDEMDELLQNLDKVGETDTEEFRKRISFLNTVSRKISETRNFADPFAQLENTSKIAKAAQLKSNIYLGIIGFLVLVGLFLFVIYEFNLYGEVKTFLVQDNYIFFWMLFVGFLAEIIAGSMGMGYGVICTTILLLLNVPPPVVSASIHSAESFTSAAGSISHYKLGNVNMKLVKSMAPYAIVGAIIGALSLSYFGEHYAHIVKPIIALYTLLIGANILRKTLSKEKKIPRRDRKTSKLSVLGIVGGFIDSFAGGGWGPLVTGSLIKDGRTPRYVIGSSTLTKFILTITSAVTFIYTMGIHHWNIVLGLLIGGVVTAPFSAMLTSKLPVKKMTIFISILVIIMSAVTIVKSFL